MIGDTTRFAEWKTLKTKTLNEVWDRSEFCAYCNDNEVVICVELDLPIQTRREADRCVGLCDHCWYKGKSDFAIQSYLGTNRIKQLMKEGRIPLITEPDPHLKYKGMFQGIEV